MRNSLSEGRLKRCPVVMGGVILFDVMVLAFWAIATLCDAFHLRPLLLDEPAIPAPLHLVLLPHAVIVRGMSLAVIATMWIGPAVLVAATLAVDGYVTTSARRRYQTYEPGSRPPDPLPWTLDPVAPEEEIFVELPQEPEREKAMRNTTPQRTARGSTR